MIQSNLDVESIGKALRSAILQKNIRDEDTAVIFYDLSYLETRIRYMTSCFPPTTLHGLAVKANPLLGVMEYVKGFGLNIGVEAASVGEVTLALKTGYLSGCIEPGYRVPADVKHLLPHICGRASEGTHHGGYGFHPVERGLLDTVPKLHPTEFPVHTGINFVSDQFHRIAYHLTGRTQTR